MGGRRFGRALPGAAALLLLAAFPATGISGAQGNDPKAPAQALKERLDTMKAINQAMREIKVWSGKGDFAQVIPPAAKVAGLVAKIPALSPEGSNVGKTRIKPEVWKNFGHYKELAGKTVQEARKLIQAAEAKDQPAVLKAFSDLANSCTRCHEPYRLPKKDE